MNRILSLVIVLLIWLLSGINPLHAQNDSNTKKQTPTDVKKLRQTETRAVDSEKNILLTNQSEELQSLKLEQLSDSVRLLELKKEILELSATDKEKKKSLSSERDNLINRDSLRNIARRLKIDSLRKNVSGFPVILDQDTLFSIYAKLGTLSPRERADVDMTRIKKVAEDYYFTADSLKISNSEYTIDISYNDRVLVSISEQDAIWMNSTKEILSKDYKARISDAIIKYKKIYSLKALVWDLIEALLVLAILSLILYWVIKVFGGIKNKIEKLRGVRFKGVKIRNYEFLDTNKQVYVVKSLFNFLKWIIILLIVYFSLTIIFGILPWTGGFSGQLLAYFLDPLQNIMVSIWHYLPNLITIIILAIFFRYFLRLLYYFKTEIEKGVLKIPGFYVDWANPTFQILRVLVLAFMIIVIFPYLPGSNSQIFKGVSVFLGVLFTFGSAGALGNVVAGLVLTYMRAYRIGDRVKIGEAIGDVIEKSLLVTKIKTIKNEIVSIPNSTVMASHTTNYSAEAAAHGLIMHTSVTIGYDAPWRKVHELLIEAALATDLIDKDPPPFVLQDSLQDFFISYQINAYTRSPTQQHIIYSDLHQNIQDKFNAAGVEIMSSHYTNIRDGNKTTIPAENLPKEYTAPSFRVKTDK